MSENKTDAKRGGVEVGSTQTDEQDSTGRIMDQMAKREQFLVSNKERIHDNDSLMLYRLPLNESQMNAVYQKTVTDYFEAIREGDARGHPLVNRSSACASGTSTAGGSGKTDEGLSEPISVN